MRAYRFCGLTILAAAIAVVAFGSAAAQPPGQLKRLQKQAEAQKKAEDDRKAAEAKKADDAKKAADFSKLESTLKAPAKLPTGPITKARATELATMIDAAIDAKLSAEKVPASPTCTDAEFLRRAYLDITGVIPPADKTKTFLDNKESDKRAKLIDDLLASSNYGKHQADIWSELASFRKPPTIAGSISARSGNG